MTVSTVPGRDASHEVFTSLSGVSEKHGLDTLAKKLVELRTWLADDLGDVERAIGEVGVHGDTLAQKSAKHLLNQDGKRLRPICVALAARVGEGFTEAARKYAVSVELVHNATLLHDDVVDLGDVRRGMPAARVVYGNAASIFGGDWLLVDALMRIESAGQPDVLARMLSVIKEMVLAESRQLERRGRLDAAVSEYFEIVDGKTASLFRWAMFAGARAGGVDERACAALEKYGQKLGVAFQLVDDVLDVAGDAAETGKSLLTDLREGKVTYPLLLAMDRDREVQGMLREVVEAKDVELDPSLGARVARAIAKTGAGEACLELATSMCKEAIQCLDALPEGRARASLESVAVATPRRRK